jgi:hypothetical protein
MSGWPSGPDSEPVFRLSYRSHNLIDPDERKAELGELFTAARGNNKRQSITGALLLSGDYFVQTLEGDESAVRALFERIAVDPRHENVAVLEARTVPTRAFPRWSMASVAEEYGAEDTYLIAHEDGISPASSRGTTPAMEAVLRGMRQAAREASQVR